MKNNRKYTGILFDSVKTLVKQEDGKDLQLYEGIADLLAAAARKGMSAGVLLTGNDPAHVVYRELCPKIGSGRESREVFAAAAIKRIRELISNTDVSAVSRETAEADCKEEAPFSAERIPAAYLAEAGVEAADVLYITSSQSGITEAVKAGADVGLAVWGRDGAAHIRADYYFMCPADVWNMLTGDEAVMREKQWLSWAMELQFIGQAGNTYSKDPFDQERFTRIREIAAEILQMKSGFEKDHIMEIFCNETGFQTPKLDTRAVIMEGDKVLLVKENCGKWSLPGGWVDVNLSIGENTAKEVEEEAGLKVVPVRLLMLQDRNRHNRPIYAYGICKAFVLCEVLEGVFKENTETVESRYFDLEELPELAEEKNTEEQIRMCVAAARTRNWEVVFD